MAIRTGDRVWISISGRDVLGTVVASRNVPSCLEACGHGKTLPAATIHDVQPDGENRCVFDVSAEDLLEEEISKACEFVSA